jgi:hypothetical protein
MKSVGNAPRKSSRASFLDQACFSQPQTPDRAFYRQYIEHPPPPVLL